jgi:hypothetical protein
MDMTWHKKSLLIKWGIIGSIIFSLAYFVPMVILQDPDFILNYLGPFGIIIWLVQWVGFLLGGWVLAIIFTASFLGIVGFFISISIRSIVEKSRRKMKTTKTKT